MKNWTWKRWTALGIILAVVIGCGVMHLVQPQVSYAFAEVMTCVGTALGAVAGYLFRKNKEDNE